MNSILLLDNYDSFTHNLQHLIEKSGKATVEVVKNDTVDLNRLHVYSKLVLSPGPGIPSQAGAMPELLAACASLKPILGVCLGMQAIAEHFGCKLKNLDRVFHGIATPIHVLEQKGLFTNCPHTFNAARYHSWVVDEKNLPPDLVVTALDDKGYIMGLRHKTLPVCGVQFHPESILSEFGETIISNWLNS
jgi:anthranilate synthase component II